MENINKLGIRLIQSEFIVHESKGWPRWIQSSNSGKLTFQNVSSDSLKLEKMYGINKLAVSQIHIYTSIPQECVRVHVHYLVLYGICACVLDKLSSLTGSKVKCVTHL